VQFDADTKLTRHASHLVTFGSHPQAKVEDDAETEAQDFLREAPEFLFNLLSASLVPGVGA
jgi:hypothetical protein